jgi:uncharacterized Zn finger protein (UPF0148 family)
MGDGTGEGTTEGRRRGGRSCPICDAPTFERHCKYVCPQHGVVVDCSDPFTF